MSVTSFDLAWMTGLFAVGYLLGNISPATLMGKIYGVDIRKEGSGNPGTTNVLRTLGKKAAACTLLIDVLKGFLPALAGKMLAASFGSAASLADVTTNASDSVFVSAAAAQDAQGILWAICAGTGALLGHMWPVVFRFKGGKGIATGFGVALALDWRVGLTALVFAALGALVTKRVSCGSVAAAVTFPIAVYFFIVRDIYISQSGYSGGWEHIWAACIGILVIWKHRSNLLRIVRGEEPSFSFLSKRDEKNEKDKNE